jgi:hypothetical protein
VKEAEVEGAEQEALDRENRMLLGELSIVASTNGPDAKSAKKTKGLG